jgi:hypothetical protein
MSRSRRFASATKAPGARSAPSRSRHPVHPAGDSHHCPGCGPRPWPSKAAIGPCTVKRGHDPLLGTISAFVVTRAGDTYKLLDPASGVLDVVPDEVADRRYRLVVGREHGVACRPGLLEPLRCRDIGELGALVGYIADIPYPARGECRSGAHTMRTHNVGTARPAWIGASGSAPRPIDRNPRSRAGRRAIHALRSRAEG